MTVACQPATWRCLCAEYQQLNAPKTRLPAVTHSIIDLALYSKIDGACCMLRRAVPPRAAAPRVA